MSALVTGATGFIGSHLAERLAAGGGHVRALVRPTSDASALEALGVEVFRGDLCDEAAVDRAVAGCTRVYHLAALTSRRASAKSTADFEAVNLGGTGHVVRAVLRHGVTRMVHGSTAGVHGVLGQSRVDERSPRRPNTTYRATKAAAEDLVESYHRGHGLPVVTARFGAVIGPRALNWLGLYRSVASGAMRGIGRGENHVPLCPVDDLADGLLRCGETPGVEGETFLLGGRGAIAMRAFLDAIADAVGAAPLARPLPGAPFRAYVSLSEALRERTGMHLPRAHTYEFLLADRRFDVSKARDRLGYRPEVPLRDAIRSTAAWYRTAGLL